MRKRSASIAFILASAFIAACGAEENFLKKLDAAARSGKPIAMSYSAGESGAEDAPYTLTLFRDPAGGRSILLLESKTCETRASWIQEGGITRRYLHRGRAAAEVRGVVFVGPAIESDMDRGFHDFFASVGLVADYLQCYAYSDAYAIDAAVDKKLGIYDIFEISLKSQTGGGESLRLSVTRDAASILTLELFGLPPMSLRLLFVQEFSTTSAGRANKRIILEDHSRRKKFDLRLVAAAPADEGYFESMKASLGIGPR